MRFAVVALMLCCTVFERFGLNFGSYSANAALLAMYVLLAIGAASSVLLLSKRRVLLYVGCISVAAASWLANSALVQGDQSSIASLMLLLVIYFPFIFVLRPGALGNIPSDWVLARLSDIGFFCALCGITQFYAQFVIRADWLFNFTSYLPHVIQGPTGFNTVIPVGTMFKSNGFFFREPSGFSFFMALSLITEWHTFRRLRRVLCFALGLLLSYSGTGILALIIGLSLPLGYKTIVRFATILTIGSVVFWLFGDALNLSFTLGRADEFGAERSSGYIRYVAPMRLLGELFDSRPWSAWIGHGPGTIFQQVRSYEFHDPTWAKMLFEYGALGFICFVALFLVMLQRPTIPLQVRGILFCSWLVMGGHLLSPENNFHALALVGLLPLATASLESARQRREPLELGSTISPSPAS